MPATWTEVGNILGPPGAAGGDTAVLGEVPSGAVNGVNTTFTTVGNFVSGSLAVFVNGVRLKNTLDYNVTGANAFQMVAAPLTGDLLTVDYRIAAVTTLPVYIGTKARFIPLSNGTQLEVQDTGGTWRIQQNWTE
jgi:hypothetical protein